MVGLSGSRNRQKISSDPRNTAWANNTDGFGHRHLNKFGWTPGTGLGSSASSYSITSHLKIDIKNDNLGLGANLAKAKQDVDNWAPGLDSFQELLTRLNGNSTDNAGDSIAEENKESTWESETKAGQKYTRIGKWGSRVKFVQGEKLGATIKNDLLELSRKHVEKITIDRVSWIQEETKKSSMHEKRRRHHHRTAKASDEESVGLGEKPKKPHRSKAEKEERRKKKAERHERRERRALKRIEKEKKKLKKLQKTDSSEGQSC